MAEIDLKVLLLNITKVTIHNMIVNVVQLVHLEQLPLVNQTFKNLFLFHHQNWTI